MNEEFIECKKHPITNCYDLTKHFIGNHGGTIVYLSPNFEIDFMRRMSRTDELQQQNQKYKEVIDKIQKHCEIEINASNHYLENHSSQQELCHKVAHQRILDILKEVE